MCEKVAIAVLCVGLAVALAAMTWGSVVVAQDAIDLLRLDARVQGAYCRVTAHVDGAQRVSVGQVYYLAGLAVDFVTRDGTAITNATALEYMTTGASWISAAERRRLFADHPVGSTARCFYDPEDPYDTVALHDTVSNGPGGLPGHVAFLVVCALFLGAPALLITFCVALACVVLVCMAVVALAHWCAHVWNRARLGRDAPVYHGTASDAETLDDGLVSGDASDGL